MKHFITLENITTRTAINAERLSANLQHTASGRTFHDLKFGFILGHALVEMIPETYKYISEVLKTEYLKARIILFI
jgi:hypothetical protein